MTKTCAPIISFLTIIFLMMPSTEAKVSSQEGATLGKELTPLGAIRAGNAEGTIPSWKGGITTPPACYKPRTFHCDPFPDDKPKFTITAENVDQHAGKLSPGQIAMFKDKKYAKTWRMPVYPTHPRMLQWQIHPSERQWELNQQRRYDGPGTTKSGDPGTVRTRGGNLHGGLRASVKIASATAT